jgi:hypothetical protein
MVCYMTWVFLIKLKFYKELHLLLFYILSFFVLGLRIGYFATGLTIYSYYENNKGLKDVSLGSNSCDILCCYFKIYMCTV